MTGEPADAPAIGDHGQDCRVAHSGGWMWRGPRHRWAEERLRAEPGLLAWLGPRVPLAVPAPEIHSDQPLRVRHRPIPGGRWRPGTDDRAEGRRLGEFLSALHALDPAEAVAAGARRAEDIAAHWARTREQLAAEAIAWLPVHARPIALTCLMRQIETADATAVFAHADLGPDHVRTDDHGHLTGIIDWLDAGVDDPARDLAWPLYGTTPAFAAGLRSAYPVPTELAERAHAHFRLVPLTVLLHHRDRADRIGFERTLSLAVDRLTAPGDRSGAGGW